MGENPNYDPLATEDEAAARSSYLSFKDFRLIGLAIVVLIALLTPIYMMGKRMSEKAQCVNNFKAMFDAIGLYARDYDDGYPPLYRADDQGLPSAGPKGMAYTWVSDIKPYMNTRATFRCPSAEESEVVYVEDPNDSSARVAVTYGMYAPYGAAKSFTVPNPDTTILIAETSNLGSAASYDPHPISGTGDGFFIAWSNGNGGPNSSTNAVTRLAFRGTADGDFRDKAGRHDAESHALTATGRLLRLESVAGRVIRQDDVPGGYWAVPAGMSPQ
jgi:hypothetical protein